MSRPPFGVARPVRALAVLLALSAPPLNAQQTTGSVVGTVEDASGAAVPGVTVSLSGENVMGLQTTSTDARGRYRFGALPPGWYEMSFKLAGFQPARRTQVRVQVGSDTEERITLRVAGRAEEVTVDSSAAVIDTQSAMVDSHYDRAWVDNAPMLRQTFFNVLQNAPGVDPAGKTGTGGGSPRLVSFGSLPDTNSYQFDGIDLTDNFNGNPTTLVRPSVDTIEQVQILSLGAPAEYGNLQGAVFNVVTRQGTNRLRGGGAYYHQSDGLTGHNTTEAQNDGFPYTRLVYRNATAQVGGPIKRDRLWFFAAYEHLRDSFAEPRTNPDQANRETLWHFFGKLNAQISPKHNVVASFNYDRLVRDHGVPPSEVEQSPTGIARKTPTPGVTYTGVLSGATVVELRYAGFYLNHKNGRAGGGDPEIGNTFVDRDTGNSSGAISGWYEYDLSRTTLAGKLSHHASDFLGGSHDFKFGVQYNNAPLEGVYGVNDLIYTYAAEGVRQAYGYDYEPFFYGGTARTVGAFVDDTFKVNDRLTVSLGVRFDNTHTRSFDGPELDSQARPTGTVFPGVDYYTWNVFSPRVGVNYALTPDKKTVFKAHYGRYYRGGSTGEFATSVPSVSPTYFGGWDLATSSFYDLELAFDNSNLRFDAGTKAPRTDQFSVSLERHLFGEVAASATYVHKRHRRFPGWQDIAGAYAPITYTDDVGPDATGRAFTIFQLVSPRDERFFLFTTPPGTRSDVNALSVDLTKRMSSDWQASASATFSRATSDRILGDTAQYNFREFGRNPNDLVNSKGLLRVDRSFTFKTQLLYTGLPGGFTVGLSYFYADGYPLLRRVRIPATNLSTPVRAEPLSDAKRFPSQSQLDVRLQKDFKFGRTGLSLLANVFNLLNDDSYQGWESTISTDAAYRRPTVFNEPRRAMLGARLEF